MKHATLLLSAIVLGTSLLQGCAAAVVAGAAGGAAVATDRRSTGRMIDDQTLELKAEGLIANDKALAGKVRVNVTSMNGVVLMTGEAGTNAQRDRALMHVRSVQGARRVYNHIRIAAPRSFSDLTHDKWITSKIKGKQTTTEGVGPTHVKVVTANSVVYLMGLVKRAEADLATKIARETKGVTRVVKLFEYTD